MTAVRRAWHSFAVFLSIASLVACGGGGGGDGGSGAPNTAPTSTAAAIATTEDLASAPATPSVTDVDVGDTHSFTIVTQPGRGTASVVSGALVYAPDSDFNGQDSFTYRATDTGGLSVVGTASVNVAPANDASTASRASRAAYSGAAASLRGAQVDDADFADTFTHQILTQPSTGQGSASVDGQGNVVYTPDAAFPSGSTTFTYRTTDSGTLSVDATALVRVYSSAERDTCLRLSLVNPDGTLNTRPYSHPCGFYAAITTRTDANNDPVTMDYLAHRPSNGALPKAIVFLIGGAHFDMAIAGTPATATGSGSGSSTFVRAAQRVAEAGYAAIVLDRPSDLTTTDLNVTDAYRASVRHAVDMLSIVRRLMSTETNVFIVGQSKGSLSAWSNNKMVAGIALTSPVTTQSLAGTSGLYVHHPTEPRLALNMVERPTFVMWESGDECSVTQPANSAALATALTGAGATVTTSIQSGSVKVTSPTQDVCGGLAHHGYLGIEDAAVSATTNWLDARVAALAGNTPPRAAFVTVTTAAGRDKRVDLRTLASDANGHTLTFELLYPTTTLGGAVSLNNGIATYTPPAGVSNRTDNFVYVVSDGNGGVGAAIVTVQIGI
jgi:hypothetical protein